MTKSQISPRKILVVGAALIALAALSFALSHVDLGGAALPIALVIAVVKAALVVGWFMELSDARASAVFAVLSGITLVALLLVFMIADVQTRDTPPLLEPPAAAAPR